MTHSVIPPTLHSTLQDLQERVTALESKVILKPSPHPPQATDAFATRMLISALAAGFTDTRFVRCRDDYYDQPLEHRRAFLQAASTHHLTKSIVLQNTRHDDSAPASSDPLRSKYLCCVVPYTARFDSDLLRDAVRRQFVMRGEVAPSVNKINYRLAEDCVGVTGYEPNGVTPLGLKTGMPVVVAKQIAGLVPKCFWMGGGEVSLKWRVEWEEFVSVFSPIVLDFAVANGE